jgi:hypothetical protein
MSALEDDGARSSRPSAFESQYKIFTASLRFGVPLLVKREAPCARLWPFSNPGQVIPIAPGAARLHFAVDPKTE